MNNKLFSGNIKRMMKRGASLSCAGIMAFSMMGPSVFAADGIVKEENVYVITKANGSVSETIVSDHLINNDKLNKIEDKSALKDIENVAGEETFKKGDGDSITWDAKGNDIYYQGNSNKDVPVTMDVKYELDGKKVSGKELQGKSGHVKISINYSNNAFVQTGGRSINVPFVVMTGFLAEGKSLENITVSNGKVIDDGDKKMVVCMATPGLANNLGVSIDSDLLNDSVTITGDANGFDVKDMMTVVSAGLMDDIDSDTFSELDMDDQIKELEKASKKLINGTRSLYDGVHMLREKSGGLQSGVSDLNDGAHQLDNGIKESSAGSKALSEGATTFYKAIDSNLATISSGAAQLSSGSQSVASGLTTLRDKIDGKGGLLESANTLASSTANLGESMGSAINESQNQLNGALQILGQMKEAGTISEEDYNKLAQSIVTSNKIQEQLRSNTDSLSQGTAAIAGGIGQVSSALNGDGTEANPGLVNGANSVSSGAKKLADGLSSTAADTSSLTAGAKSIADGAARLDQGQKQLSKGASQLASGMQQLYDSTGTLIGGINKLDAGAKNLQKGMKQYYNDGIKQIIDLYNDDIKGLSSDFESIVNAGKEYQTFTTLNNGMSGNVKFIYKTELA